MKEESPDDGLWKAMADPTRRGLVEQLRRGARTTGELCAWGASERGLSRIATMKHLAVLEAAGLVMVRREGKFRWNYLNALPFVDVYRRFVSPLASTALGWTGLRDWEKTTPDGSKEQR